jgi:gamma-glutamyltranspeptidase/glutathione hydrolase
LNFPEHIMKLEDPTARLATHSHRPAIMGTKHVIAAGHYLAAHAGFEILEAGGNAIDAGVASGIALGVLQTDKVNFGGVAPMIIYLAKKREIHCIDGLGVWPRAITPDYFQRHHGGKIPPGVLRSVVPAAPDAWITALSRFGTMSFGEVAAAAIRFARDGFPMYPLMSEFIKDHRSSYERWPSSKKVFLPKGRAPEPGELFVQADLARTLQYLADAEKANRRKGRRAALQAARDAFYKGDVAAAIVKFHKQSGGLMTMEDFAAFNVKFEPTVKAKFHGIEVHACGPWSQGPVVPMALNILKGYNLGSLGHNSPEYIHVVTEALKLAFADRHQHFGDPSFIKVPMKGLLSDAYSDHRRGMIRADRAWPEMPPAGRSGDARGPAASLDDAAAIRGSARARRHDLHVLHRQRRQRALGHALGRLEQFAGRAGRRRPVLRPRHTIVVRSHASMLGRAGQAPAPHAEPALAFKNGKVLMPFGTPGGDVQPQAMLQVFLNVNVFGMDAQSAIEAPRFAGYSFPGSFEPHEYFPGRLYLERRIPAGAGDVLNRLGHKVYWWDEWTWLAGAPCTIVVDHKTGVMQGGADPRRPAYALGW